jgi:hypothetical protein
MNKYKIHQQLETQECGPCEVVAIYKIVATNLDPKINLFVYLLRTTDGDFLYQEDQINPQPEE